MQVFILQALSVTADPGAVTVPISVAATGIELQSSHAIGICTLCRGAGT